MDWQPGLTQAETHDITEVLRPHVAHLRSSTEEEYPPPGHGLFSFLHVLTSWKTFLQATGLDEKASAAGAVDRNGASSRGMVSAGLVTGVVASDGQGAVSFRE